VIRNKVQQHEDQYLHHFIKVWTHFLPNLTFIRERILEHKSLLLHAPEKLSSKTDIVRMKVYLLKAELEGNPSGIASLADK
jgi:hypothetical protein